MAHEYLFDLTLVAAVRVKAEDVREAKRLLKEQFDCATITAGNWPSGEPAEFEASIEGNVTLSERDEIYIGKELEL